MNTCIEAHDLDNGFGGWITFLCDRAAGHTGQHHDPRGMWWTVCLAGHRHQE